MEPVRIVAKKPIWSTYVRSMDGTGVVIHNYADGTNSGPLLLGAGIHPIFSNYYIRTIRATPIQ